MGQTADQLRQELDRKRNELTRDVDLIEDKVRTTFDINHQVEQNPLLAVGLALAGGFVLGNMIGGGDKHKDTAFGDTSGRHGSFGPTGGYSEARFYGGEQRQGGASFSPAYAPSQSYSGQYSSQPHDQHQGPGVISTVAAGMKESFRKGAGGSSIEDALGNVTAALTAVLMEKAKELLDENLPGFADKYEQAARRGRIESTFAPSGSTMPYSSGAGIDQAVSGSTAADAPASTGSSATSSGVGSQPPRPAANGEPQHSSSTTRAY